MADFDPGVADAEIAAVFDPFVKERFALDDPAWTTLVSDNARLQRRNRLRRRLIGWAPSFRRTQDSIQRDYSQQWAAQTFNAQLSIEGPTVPCLWRTTGMLARAIATKRVHLLFLMGVIARLKPTNVLEVGCGNGLNLFVLAGRFPGIRFTGIELTAGGIAAAEAVCALPELPQAVQDFAPEPLIDPKPFDRITIRQGNAAALPLSDRSFDLVFTSLALEQMEQIRSCALAEIARVARAHTTMVEPFFEWNATGPQRDYVIANDYFSGRMSDLPGVGLMPIFSTADMPHKLINHPGLVVCRVLRTLRMSES